MFSIDDWKRAHSLSTSTIADIIAANGANSLVHAPFFREEAETYGGDQHAALYGELDYNLQAYVVPAFSTLFGGLGEVTELLARVEFAGFSCGEELPHTEDLGPERAPVIRMEWDGRADDLICLAHEVAHALQIMMSDHEPMPPVAREVCAFLGELALIAYCREQAPNLNAALSNVWHAENERYLGSDLDALSDALNDPETPYQYRLNYPLARLAAVQLHRRGAGDWYRDLFSSGRLGMQHLPIECMANMAGDLAIYLPPMTALDMSQPTIDAYRSLGAMALLDIDYWQGESEKRIEDYYSGLLEHLRNSTAFIALNDDRKPVAYATWTKPAGAGAVTITRQAAPFGDHLLLQQALEVHLGHAEAVTARHVRSARQEQLAW
ncbi:MULTISPECIES: hypothetical protein [unclassified Yoonia]|uniref:hypothetical protein n=1 Tax=unclassified Yoonia TaxID=2629118 RepID=UPI002AFF36B4|nr:MULTISPECIES: hypothetical protein [unclassified Yoonia]